MKKYLLLFTSVFALGMFRSQVGVNTSSPKATLDIVNAATTDRVLKLSNVANNINKSATSINYTKGTPLYIDDQGYVYTVFSPSNIAGQSAPFDKNQMPLTTQWQTIYTLPSNGSIADFKFYTNFSMGSGGLALVSGKMSVGTGTGLSLYDSNSGVNAIDNISGNRTSGVLSVNFTGGASLQFQLNGRDLQVKLSSSPPTNSNITIYDSAITRG